MGSHWDLLLCVVSAPLKLGIKLNGSWEHRAAPRRKDPFFKIRKYSSEITYIKMGIIKPSN